MRLWDNLAFVTDNKRFTCPPRNGALRALTVGAVGRFAVGGWASGHRGGSPWPWYGALTASALEPTNGGERRAKGSLCQPQAPPRTCLRAHKGGRPPGQGSPRPATGPLRRPPPLRSRNSGSAGRVVS